MEERHRALREHDLSLQRRCLSLRERPQAESRADVPVKDEDGLQERENLLRLRRLHGLPTKGELHPREPLQEADGRMDEASHRLEEVPAPAAGGPRTNHIGGRRQAAGQPEHPGRRSVCRHQGRHELPQIPLPRYRKCTRHRHLTGHGA